MGYYAGASLAPFYDAKINGDEWIQKPAPGREEAGKGECISSCVYDLLDDDRHRGGDKDRSREQIYSADRFQVYTCV